MGESESEPSSLVSTPEPAHMQMCCHPFYWNDYCLGQDKTKEEMMFLIKEEIQAQKKRKA